MSDRDLGDCERCGHPVKAHAYDGPREGFRYTWPCLACECLAPSRTGPCARCGKPRSAHFKGDCPIAATRYSQPLSFQPATARGVAALVAQIDYPAGGASPEFIEGMDFLANQLNEQLEQ